MTQPAPQLPGPDFRPPDWWEDEKPEPGWLRSWLAANPAGHGTFLAVPGVWGLAAVLHEAGMTWQWGGAGTAVAVASAAAVAEWIATRPVEPWEEPPATIGPVEAALATGLVGAWVTTAAEYGAPLWGGPHAWLTWLWALGATAGYYAWLRRHPAVLASLMRREDGRTYAERKAFWDDLIRRLPQLSDGSGADVIDHIPTLVGEQVCLDTRGTGHMATEIRTKLIEERVGELWPKRIPRGRVDCWVDDYPGRIWITVRTKNPWKHPVVHPLLDRRSIAAKFFDAPPTCTRPLVIGLDPEDGEPFGLGGSGIIPAGVPAWVPDQGGQVILVVSTKGGGKTNAINCLTAAATACDDMRVLQVNLTKPGDARAWEPACPASALGRHALGRARAILTWVEHYIDDYADTAYDAIAAPSNGQPHLMVIVDEVADVAEDDICKAALVGIARKCRSAGVTLVIAGQRATARWLGGADLRAMIDYVLVGRFARRDEQDKAVGAHLDLPDLANYGKGAAGVMMLVELISGDYDRGRTLKLKEPRDCRRIARTRSHLARWTPAGMAPDQAWLWDRITGDDDVDLDAYLGPPSGGDDENQAAPEHERATDTGPRPAAPERRPAPDPRASHLAGMVAALRGAWEDRYGTVPLQANDAIRMLALIAMGTSNADAARILFGDPKARMTIQRWAKILADAGLVRVEGEKPRQRRILTEAGEAFLDLAAPVPAGAGARAGEHDDDEDDGQ